ISDAGHLARSVVLDLRNVAFRADLHVPGRLALGDLGVERRPFRAPLAALEAEAGLMAGDPAVAGNRVDRHPAGMTFLVTELVRASLEDLEIVAPRQAWPVACAGDTHLILGLAVVGLKVGEGDRPIEKVGAWNMAVGRRI